MATLQRHPSAEAGRRSAELRAAASLLRCRGVPLGEAGRQAGPVGIIPPGACSCGQLGWLADALAVQSQHAELGDGLCGCACACICVVHVRVRAHMGQKRVTLSTPKHSGA